MPRAFLSIRLLVPLPVVVDGGRTRWRLEFGRHGKNGCKGELLAQCLTDPAVETIVIASGRAPVVRTQHRHAIHAEEGTLLHLIFLKLLREGRAERTHDT